MMLHWTCQRAHTHMRTLRGLKQDSNLPRSRDFLCPMHPLACCSGDLLHLCLLSSALLLRYSPLFIVPDVQGAFVWIHALPKITTFADFGPLCKYEARPHRLSPLTCISTRGALPVGSLFMVPSSDVDGAVCLGTAR